MRLPTDGPRATFDLTDEHARATHVEAVPELHGLRLEIAQAGGGSAMVYIDCYNGAVNLAWWRLGENIHDSPPNEILVLIPKPAGDA